jgi:hypothetical protein
MHCGLTFSGPKAVLCAPDIILLGYRCSFDGRHPDPLKVQKLIDWKLPCESLSEVRSFLGTAGIMRQFIKDFATKARPLEKLKKKDAPFVFGDIELKAVREIQAAAIEAEKNCALVPIDYKSGREVILAVDSSNITVGYVLYQADEKGRWRPSRFGSVAWTEVEGRYSQPKLELYGVYKALQMYRIWLIGLPQFTIEVDAKYIKGMLNHPDIQPTMVLNRWISWIHMFNFEL